MKIRRLAPEDAAPAAALDRQWSADDWARIAEGKFPDRLALAGDLEGRFSGFLLVSLLPPDAEILNLAVLPGMRRQGLATALMHAALEQMAQAGVTRVRLDVRESNTAAVGLYQRLGFHQTGRRSQYYQDPAEDALLLETVLTLC